MSKVIEFKYTCRTVPKDSLRLFDNVSEDFFSFRTDIKAFPTIRNFVNRTEFSICIIRESVGNFSVNSQYQVHTFFFCFLHQIQSQVKFVVLTDRDTDFATHCFSKCICHTTCDNQVVHFAQQVFDDFDFRRNFRATHDSSERTFDVVQYFINSLHFFLH